MKLINWNDAWKERNRLLDHDRSPEFWNKMAPRFRRHRKTSDDETYASLFYEYSALKQGETVFDMGCASGTLAIPFAQKGHVIYAADFSPDMLECLMEEARAGGVSHMIKPVLLDWNEDWEVRDLPVCDVAIASRSLVAEDLTLALKKLESVATGRVCVGAFDKPTHHYDRKLAKAIGYERHEYGNYVYILNELINRDRYPELRFINYNTSNSRYISKEDMRKCKIESFQYGLTGEQIRKMDEYLDANTVKAEENGEMFYYLDNGETASIAHIMWSAE